MPIANTNRYERVDEGVRVITRKGDQFLTDPADEAIARRHCWSPHEHGYARAVTRMESGKQKTIYLHRLIFATTADLPHVDHINGNPADCRRQNLRVCTRSQNLMNQGVRSDSTTGQKGVGALSGNRFRARVRVNGQEHHLGVFSNPNEAARAATAGRKRLHKEFARHE